MNSHLAPGQQEPRGEASIELDDPAFGTGLAPGRLESRGPELIEAGMVYVDPDPEIGSPPRAAGWTERLPAGSHSHDEPGSRTNAAVPEEGGARQSLVDEVTGLQADDSGATEERGGSSMAALPPADGRETGEAADEPGPVTAAPELDKVDREATGEAPAAAEASAGVGEAGGGSEVGDVAGAGFPGEAEDAKSADTVDARGGEGAGGSTGFAGAAGASFESPTDGAPWAEPALPMAWPPGMAPSGRGESSPPPFQEGDPAHGDSAPRPDPSWPRLFGRNPGGEDIGSTVDLSDPREPTTGPSLEIDHEGSSEEAAEHPGSQREDTVPEPGSEGEPGSSAIEPGEAVPSQALLTTASDLPVGQSGGPAVEVPHVTPEASHAVSEDTGEEAAASMAPGTSGNPPTNPPPIVDVTTHESEIERGPGDQPEYGRVGAEAVALEARALPTPTHEAGEDVSQHAKISTVARAVRAEEVDLREAPVHPGGGNVSRETSADGGDVMDPSREGDALEDEAAIAVRDAVSRAAAEAGVDVSRETDPMEENFSIDEPSVETTIDTESAARSARVTFRIHREALNGARRVLAVANQKGGVGKSTTAVNLGAYLALAGARVLVVDLDPQGNASTGLGLDHRDIEPSIYDVLTGEAATAAAIRATGVPNLHVLPSTIDLAGAEVELVSAMSRETRLRRALQSIDQQYDAILIDCPPSLGLLTVNALAAADELLIPIQCEYYALEGLGQLLRNVELVRANLNPELRIGGIVLTMYDGRTRLALQVVEEVRKHFTDVVYQTVVPRSVRLSEAPGYGLPIALYDPLSRGGIAYRDLTYELAERSGLLAPTGEGAS